MFCRNYQQFNRRFCSVLSFCSALPIQLTPAAATVAYVPRPRSRPHAQRRRVTREPDQGIERSRERETMRLHLNASSAQLLRSTAIRTLRFFSSVAIHTRCFSRYPGDGFSSRERQQCQFEHATHTRAVSHARSLGCWRYVNNTRWPSSRAGSRLQSRPLGGAIFRHKLTSTSTPNVLPSVRDELATHWPTV